MFAASIAMVSLVACGGGEDTGGDVDNMEAMDGGAEGMPRDVRVQIPEDDGVHFYFVGGEDVIQPGEEKTTCFHMEVPEDLAITDIEMMQGEFGHHAVIVSSNEPLPPGTVEDCTDETTYAKYKALLIPIDDPPDDAAFFLKKGTPVVLQSHYVNASDEPILVRDIVGTRKVQEAEVATWMAPFTATALGFEVPAGDDVTELSFDCNFDRDVELLYVGGHMHEQGSSYDIQLGPSTEELETIYTVDGWIPDFRDLPPIEIYRDDPLKITAGTVLRTTCRWQNKTGEPLRFPQEMCVSFGVLAGSQESYDCRFSN